MKLILLAVLSVLALPLAAQVHPTSNQAFPIEIDLQAEGLDVTASSSRNGNVALVTLANAGAGQALCEVTFVNGPERPPLRRIRLEPGEEGLVSQAFKREVNRIRVTVDCNPA